MIIKENTNINGNNPFIEAYCYFIGICALALESGNFIPPRMV